MFHVLSFKLHEKVQLHNLQKYKIEHKKRVGRGGKRGTYSGRGLKGQKSRAGRRIRPAERDLIIRIPKRRGFRNKPKSPKPKIFNLEDIERVLKTAGKKNIVFNKKFLVDAGLLPKNFRGPVKILGEGEISPSIRVEGLKVSRSAKEKIERAGGRVLKLET